MKIIKSDNKYTLSTDVEILEQLPIANYNLNYNLKEGCFLVKKEDFILPDKIYGDLEVAYRALKKWSVTNNNLGVYLVGQSGSGKTLTGKYIAKNANVPVIFITHSNFEISEFGEFLSSIEQDVCLFFDEWEKVFVKNQDAFLSILDGLFNSQYKKLFLFTSNEDNISRYMTNRPSRVFYKQQYGFITLDVFEEIIKDVDLDVTLADSLRSLLDDYDYQLNIDTVFSIISEMKLHNQTAKEVIPYFNFQLPKLNYSVVFVDDQGNKYEIDSYYSTDFIGNVEIYLTGRTLPEDSKYYSEFFMVSSKEKTSNGFVTTSSASLFRDCKLLFNKIKSIGNEKRVQPSF